MRASSGARLLLACCRPGATAADVEAGWLAGIDWNQLVRWSVRHGLAPQLYVSLKGGFRGCVPADAFATLAEAYRNTALRNLNLYGILGQVAKRCREAGIPVIVLKGAALAGPIYRDIALRPMGDLDILVASEHLDRAAEIVTELGLVPDQSYRPSEWYRVHHHHAVPFQRPGGMARVEVHHHIVPPDPPLPLPAADLWARAVPLRIPGAEVLGFDPEDLLIHLCLHLAHADPFSGKLRTVCDLAQVIAHGSVDWGRFSERVRAYRVDRYVYYALQTAANVLKAPVPATVWQAVGEHRVRPWPVDWFTRAAARRLVLNFGDAIGPVPHWRLQSLLGVLLASSGGPATLLGR